MTERAIRGGRFWAGTMAYDESPDGGALYRLELDGSCTTVLTGLTIANGIGWSTDNSTMYLPPDWKLTAEHRPVCRRLKAGDAGPCAIAVRSTTHASPARN